MDYLALGRSIQGGSGPAARKWKFTANAKEQFGNFSPRLRNLFHSMPNGAVDPHVHASPE
jgi:hypothetical protein